MPFDDNLTLINGVSLTTATHTPAVLTTYHATNRCRVIDFGASLIGGAGPEGTGVNGISVALVCTAAVTAGNVLDAYIEACDSATSWTNGVIIGTFETSTGATAIASSLAPFHYVIRVHTEMRYVRANLTVDGGTWATIWVVVGTHHLERL